MIQRYSPGRRAAGAADLSGTENACSRRAGPDGSWLATSRPTADTGTHADETAVPGAHRC
ncbi:hypothetical protein [Streptomyces sp. NPDC090112]|uniref:hypothetical protein n=1 Tax=Streptomyces sp. NPDC090112 TaxID=3365949 RepID=UPI00382DAE3D